MAMPPQLATGETSAIRRASPFFPSNSPSSIEFMMRTARTWEAAQGALVACTGGYGGLHCPCCLLRCDGVIVCSEGRGTGEDKGQINLLLCTT